MTARMYHDLVGIARTSVAPPITQLYRHCTIFNGVLEAIICLSFYCAYHYFLSPLAGIPGPLSARLGFDTWLLSRAVKRDAGWKLRGQHDEKVGTCQKPLSLSFTVCSQGLFVRIARNQVSVADPEALKTIFKR